MQSLKTGDVVTITKIDRAARNIADMVNITKELAEKGASIRILDMNIDTTTATGTLMLNIFASVAQFERDQMLVRQRIGIEAAKARDKTLPLQERTYKGAKPTARAKADSVRALLHPVTAKSVSLKTWVSVSPASTVYLKPRSNCNKGSPQVER